MQWLTNHTGEVTHTRQARCDELDPEGKPLARKQGVSNLRPPIWKSQAQTTGPPRRVSSGLSLNLQINKNDKKKRILTRADWNLEGLLEMDFPCKESDLEESLTPGMFKIPGEPAVVINGLPPVSSSADTSFPCPIVTDAESLKNVCFGQWLVGREVRKLFGDQNYYGKVIDFDGEVGWFRVKYEDGDVEDLEWHELEQVLRPLDITIPLITIATKINKRKQRSIQNSEGRTRNQGVKMTKTV